MKTSGLQRRPCAILLFGLLLTAPATLFANAGTPLMWVEMGHLAFGNAIIGIVEGVLVALFFRASLARSLGWMILANYASMGVGIVAVQTIQASMAETWLGEEPFAHVEEMLWLLGGVSFVASLVVEWPFCWAALKSDRRTPLWKPPLASLLAQTASYAVLVPFYLSVCNVTVCTEVTPAPVASIAAPDPVTVYFISSGDRGLWKIRLDGTGRVRVTDGVALPRSNRLVIRPGSRPGEWEVCSDPQAYGELLRPLASVSAGPALDAVWKDACPSAGAEKPRGLPISDFRGSMNFCSLTHYDAGIRTDFWAGGGLRVRDFRVGLETPFLRWAARCATVTPSGQVVFQLGDQILLLDPASRRMGLLARGWSPLVVPDPEGR